MTPLKKAMTLQSREWEPKFILLPSMSYWGCTADKPNWTSEERQLVNVVHIGQPYRAQDRMQMVENRSGGQMEDIQIYHGEGNATHSSVLACRIPWTEGDWHATVHGVTKELDMTQQLEQQQNKRGGINLICEPPSVIGWHHLLHLYRRSTLFIILFST